MSTKKVPGKAVRRVALGAIKGQGVACESPRNRRGTHAVTWAGPNPIRSDQAVTCRACMSP